MFDAMVEQSKFKKPLTLRASDFERSVLLKNRIVVPPMASQTSEESGLPTEKSLNHYSRLAESGAGLVFVEYTFVTTDGRSEPNQMGITHPNSPQMFSELAKRIKISGARPGLQITHAGGKSQTALTHEPLFTPSGIPVPGIKGDGESSVPAKQADIRRVQEAFFKASEIAVSAGFDVVEFHCAHGYGLNQWLSPLTNHRTDEFGGNQVNRNRLIREVIEKVRQAFPHLILSARFPGQDFLEGGLTQDDMVDIANDLANAGLNILNVSSGLGGWRRPRDRNGEGYLLNEAVYLAEKQKLPVIAVGGFESVQGVEAACSKVPLVALGRKILDSAEKFRDEFRL